MLWGLGSGTWGLRLKRSILLEFCVCLGSCSAFIAGTATVVNVGLWKVAASIPRFHFPFTRSPGMMHGLLTTDYLRIQLDRGWTFVYGLF